MEKIIQSTYTESQFRQMLREEIRAVLNEKSNPIEVESDVLTAEEAAVFLGLSKSSLYKLTMKNAVPFSKREGGRKMTFSRSELLEWKTKK